MRHVHLHAFRPIYKCKKKKGNKEKRKEKEKKETWTNSTVAVPACEVFFISKC